MELLIGYIFLVYISFFVSKFKFGRFLTFLSSFVSLYSFFACLSMMGLYGLRIPSADIHYFNFTYLLIVIVIVTIFARPIYSSLISKEDEQINMLIPYILECVGLASISYLFVQGMILFVSTGSLTSVRAMFFSENLFQSDLMYIFLKTFPTGILNAMIIFFVWMYFNQMKMKYLCIAFVNAIVMAFSNGGRYALELFLFSAFLFYLIEIHSKNTLSQNSARAKKVAVSLALLMLTVLVVSTMARNQSFLSSLGVYFAGSFSFLDLICSSPNLFALNDHMYGYLTFGAILEPFVLLLKFLHLTDMKIPSYYFNIYCQSFYNIGSSSHILFNNNTTVLYYWLRDYGFAGIIIGSTFLGGLTTFFYNKMHEGKVFFKLVFVYFCVVLFNSVMTYQFFGQAPFVVILTLYLCTKSTRKCKK